MTVAKNRSHERSGFVTLRRMESRASERESPSLFTPQVHRRNNRECRRQIVAEMYPRLLEVEE